MRFCNYTFARTARCGYGEYAKDTAEKYDYWRLSAANSELGSPFLHPPIRLQIGVPTSQGHLRVADLLLSSLHVILLLFTMGELDFHAVNIRV